jgi:hypothetical protein
MPGPPPEHQHLRLLKGNPGKRPARSPPEPARAEDCPPPPRHLSDYAKEEWQHIAPELHRLNLLTVLDLSALAEGPPSFDSPGKRDTRPPVRASPNDLGGYKPYGCGCRASAFRRG